MWVKHNVSNNEGDRWVIDWPHHEKISRRYCSWETLREASGVWCRVFVNERLGP